MKKMKSAMLAGILCLAFAAISGQAQAVDFSGKTVELLIPFSVGGGSDVWARIYAPFMSRHLPGNPTVMVKNMPGGGSIVGANHFHAKAAKDGLTLLGSSGSTIFPYLLDVSQVKYDFSRYPVVLGSPTGGVAYIKPEFGVKNAAGLKGFKAELFYASQGATSLDIIPLLAFEMLGLEVKALFGYKGRGAGRVAFESGEVNIDYQTTSAFIQNVRPLVAQGQAVPLMTWGVVDAQGRIVRDPVEPELPSFPEAYEMVHGQKPSGPAWDAWKAFMIAGFGVQKCFWLQEGTPRDIIDAYRGAAQKIMADPEFKVAVDKSLGGYPQLAGLDAEKAFEAVLSVGKETKDWMKKWLKDRYGVTLN